MNKMVLIPYSELQYLKQLQQQHSSTVATLEPLRNPIEQQMAQNVRTMDNSLANPKISKSEKIQNYQQAFAELQSHADRIADVHNDLTENESSPAPTFAFDQQQPSAEKIKRKYDDRQATNNFLALPKNARLPASNLLQHMTKEIPQSSLTWDRHGVSLSGKKLNGVNIVDLLSDLVRHRAVPLREETKGLLRIMRRHNIPESFIKNKSAIAFYRSASPYADIDSSLFDDATEMPLTSTSTASSSSSSSSRRQVSKPKIKIKFHPYK